MATNLGTYQIGETLPMRRQTKDTDGSLVAPVSLTFKVRETGGAEQEFVLGADAEVETIATGDYQLNYDTTTAGPVELRCIMESGGKTVIEHATALVESSNTA